MRNPAQWAGSAERRPDENRPFLFEGSCFNVPIESIGIEKIASYEQSLLAYGTSVLADLPGVRIVGTAAEKASVLSFTVEGAHPHDVGTILDQEGVAIRTGHHCAQPVMDFYGLPATARASLALYNTCGEIDALAAALRKVAEVFT